MQGEPESVKLAVDELLDSRRHVGSGQLLGIEAHVYANGNAFRSFGRGIQYDRALLATAPVQRKVESDGSTHRIAKPGRKVDVAAQKGRVIDTFDPSYGRKEDKVMSQRRAAPILIKRGQG